MQRKRLNRDIVLYFMRAKCHAITMIWLGIGACALNIGSGIACAPVEEITATTEDACDATDLELNAPLGTRCANDPAQLGWDDDGGAEAEMGARL